MCQRGMKTAAATKRTAAAMAQSDQVSKRAVMELSGEAAERPASWCDDALSHDLASISFRLASSPSQALRLTIPSVGVGGRLRVGGEGGDVIGHWALDAGSHHVGGMSRR